MTNEWHVKSNGTKCAPPRTRPSLAAARSPCLAAARTRTRATRGLAPHAHSLRFSRAVHSRAVLLAGMSRRALPLRPYTHAILKRP
eukprot:7259683-Prymnesium_polylepis.3